MFGCCCCRVWCWQQQQQPCSSSTGERRNRGERTNEWRINQPKRRGNKKKKLLAASTLLQLIVNGYTRKRETLINKQLLDILGKKRDDDKKKKKKNLYGPARRTLRPGLNSSAETRVFRYDEPLRVHVRTHGPMPSRAWIDYKSPSFPVAANHFFIRYLLSFFYYIYIYSWLPSRNDVRSLFFCDSLTHTRTCHRSFKHSIHFLLIGKWMYDMGTTD